MTVIVVTKDSITSDSQMTSGGGYPNMNYKKIYDLGDAYIGMAGDASQALAVLEWISNGSIPEEKPTFANYTESSGYTLLGIEKETGQAFIFDGGDVNYSPVPTPFSIGSGSDAALGALTYMKMKKLDPCGKEAVKVAIQNDVFSGGTVKHFKIDKKKAKEERIKFEAQQQKEMDKIVKQMQEAEDD